MGLVLSANTREATQDLRVADLIFRAPDRHDPASRGLFVLSFIHRIHLTQLFECPGHEDVTIAYQPIPSTHHAVNRGVVSQDH